MLVDGDQVIGETSIIIEHVAGARLVPSLESRKWDRICDQYISDALQATETAGQGAWPGTVGSCSRRSSASSNSSAVWRATPRWG